MDAIGGRAPASPEMVVTISGADGALASLRGRHPLPAG
jgi:hypothetical protein